MILSCTQGQKNIGVSSCLKLPEQIKGFITTPKNFSLSYENASNPASWQTAILAAKSARVYLWPTSQLTENTSEETILESTSLSNLLVRDGRYGWRMMFKVNLELHKAIFSHTGFNGRVFLIDNEDKIIGTDVAGNFAGCTIDLLNPEKLMFNDGSVTSKTPVSLSLRNNREIDVHGKMIDGSFLSSLIALTGVNLTVLGTPTATNIDVSVTSDLDNEGLLGLAVADFVLLTAGGAAQVINTIVDNDDGTYSLAGAGWVTGTLNLVSASALSVTGFESNGKVIVTI